MRPRKKVMELQQSCTYNLVLPACPLFLTSGLEGRERLSESNLLVFYTICSEDSLSDDKDLVQTLFPVRPILC